MLAKIGATPQQIPPGDIYPALERGTIDAAEFVAAYDDERLGFNKVAKYYYTPGWWEGSAQVSMLVNQKAWDALPKQFQDALEVAAAEQDAIMLAHYDDKNPAALKRMIGSGTQLRTFSKPILDAAYKASNELLEEYAAKSPEFKKIYTEWLKYRDEQNLWFRVAEYPLDSYRSPCRPAQK